jgi:hypothetical protein
VATCRTNSRRRKAKGPAPNICNKEKMKSLTGQPTYATKEHKTINRKPPLKSPAYLAFNTLLCCAYLFASMPSTAMLKCRPDNTPAANNPQTSAPTNTAKQSFGTAGHNKGAKLGARTAKPTPGETAKDRFNHRYTHTTKKRSRGTGDSLPHL